MLYKPKTFEFGEIKFDERHTIMDDNWKQIVRLDQEAKNAGRLVGQYLKEPYADGYAIYQIIKENKNTVRIKVCTYIGDDWVLPYWGEETTIKKAYAVDSIVRREELAKLFS